MNWILKTLWCPKKYIVNKYIKLQYGTERNKISTIYEHILSFAINISVFASYFICIIRIFVLRLSGVCVCVECVARFSCNFISFHKQNFPFRVPVHFFFLENCWFSCWRYFDAYLFYSCLQMLGIKYGLKYKSVYK